MILLHFYCKTYNSLAILRVATILDKPGHCRLVFTQLKASGIILNLFFEWETYF